MLPQQRCRQGGRICECQCASSCDLNYKNMFVQCPSITPKENVCVYHIQISNEQKKLDDHEKIRVLEKSNFRPMDLATQKFKKERFKRRWSVTCTTLFGLVSFQSPIRRRSRVKLKLLLAMKKQHKLFSDPNKVSPDAGSAQEHEKNAQVKNESADGFLKTQKKVNGADSAVQDTASAHEEVKTNSANRHHATSKVAPLLDGEQATANDPFAGGRVASHKIAPAPDEGVGDAEIAHDEHAHSASASARSAKAKVFPMPVDEALSGNGIDADAGDASANMGPTSRKVAPAPYHDDNELTVPY